MLGQSETQGFSNAVLMGRSRPALGFLLHKGLGQLGRAQLRGTEKPSQGACVGVLGSLPPTEGSNFPKAFSTQSGDGLSLPLAPFYSMTKQDSELWPTPAHRPRATARLSPRPGRHSGSPTIRRAPLCPREPNLQTKGMKIGCKVL